MVGVQFPFNRMFIIALAVFCVAGTYLFLFRTRAGLRIRAVTQNRGMSTCLAFLPAAWMRARSPSARGWRAWRARP